MEDIMSDAFPEGLRVLVVDDDETCLKIVGRLLQYCKFKVTACNEPSVALSILREKKGEFDLVITDVRMPNMNGFELLEHIELEFNIPVVMMSADCEKEVVINGLKHGACFYLTKPIKVVELMNIWQYVVRKKQVTIQEIEQTGSIDDNEQRITPQGKETEQKGENDEIDIASSVNEGGWEEVEKIDDENDSNEKEHEKGLRAQKRSRVIWTNELQAKFLHAINRLGIEKAVPKKILELMNAPELSRENVASHLQKYRLYVKRTSYANRSSVFGRPFRSSIFGQIPNHQLQLNYKHQQNRGHLQFQGKNTPLTLQSRLMENGNNHTYLSDKPLIHPMLSCFEQGGQQMNNFTVMQRYGHSSMGSSNQVNMNGNHLGFGFPLQGENQNLMGHAMRRADERFSMLNAQGMNNGFLPFSGNTGSYGTQDHYNGLIIPSGFNGEAGQASSHMNLVNDFSGGGQYGLNQVGGSSNQNLYQMGSVGRQSSNEIINQDCILPNDQVGVIGGKEDIQVLEHDPLSYNFDLPEMGNSDEPSTSQASTRIFADTVQQYCSSFTEENQSNMGSDSLSDILNDFMAFEPSSSHEQFATETSISRLQQDLTKEGAMDPDFNVNEYWANDNLDDK